VIDGIEIANPNHFGYQGTGGGPISAINTDFVSEIDFYAGAFPARYGDKASRGLDVKQTEGLRDRFHFKAELGMAGMGGIAEGPLKQGKGSFMLSYRKSYLDLIAGSWGGMTAIPKYWNTQSKTVWDFSPKTKLSLFTLYSEDGIKIDTEDEEEGSANSDDEARKIESQTRQYAVGTTLRHVFNGGYIEGQISAIENKWRQQIKDSTEMNVKFRNYSTEKNATIRIDGAIFPFGTDEVSFGAFYKNCHLDYEYFFAPESVYLYEPGTDSIVGFTGIIYSNTVYRKKTTDKYGGYTQYKKNLGQKIVLTTGIRLDALSYTGNYTISPRVSLAYNFNEQTSLSSGYGRHYQSPEWFMLVQNGVDTKLKSKYTDQYILGLSHLFAPDLKGTIETYYKPYSDVPVTRDMTTDDPLDYDPYFVNSGKGDAKGIEFFLQKKVKKNFWGTLSYSYSESKAKDPRNENEEFSWDFDYRNVGTLILGYRQEYMKKSWYEKLSKKPLYKAVGWLPGMPSDESEYTLKFRYLGGRPYTKPVYHPELRMWLTDPETKINSSREDPYTRLDLFLKSRWYFGKWSLFTFFEVDNVLDKENLWGIIYNKDGTQTKVNQLRRMIIGGFIVEF
jgi:outer membrane receptor protein involved in Fe transport